VNEVTFWFDPLCPFTWRTSRWLRAVAPRRNASVDWRVMSLAILNADQPMPEQWRAVGEWAVLARRLLMAAKLAHGNDGIDRLYTEIGTLFHDRSAVPDETLLKDALGQSGLPGELYGAVADETLDEQIRVSHEAGQARVGTASGSPITAIGQAPGFFGPVVVPIPEGEDAENLFDGLTLLSSVPQFSEIKRARESF
jgi:2-hydroxychromene-2-carboxylate isomerase